ncbi:MFS transporter [Falsiroseomonas sp. HW251]|uniref:MFS transporter n=1 Tax=Falsiroseomonas sp. HW251 TaxID=3390998 RepID=UPI003D32200C
MARQAEISAIRRYGPKALPWRAALAATLLMQIVAVFATQALPVLAPLVTRGTGMAPEAIGRVYGVAQLGTILFLLFGMPVLARLGPVRTLQLGAGLAGLGLTAAVFGSPLAVFAAALLIGLGNAPSIPAGSRILAATAPPAHRTLIFSVKQAGAPLGGMTAALVLPWLAEKASWPAALALVIFALFAATVTVQPMQAALDAERDRARDISPRALLSPANVATLFKALTLHPLLMPLAALCFGFAAATGCLWALQVSFLVEARGETLAQAGLAAAAMQAGGIAGRLILGWLGDRTGAATRNLLVQAFVAAGCLATLVILPASAPQFAFLLVSALAGATASSWQGIALAELARVTPAERVAEATAGASIIGFLGFAVGPAVCAWAISVLQDWTAPLLAVPALLAAGATLLAPRLRKVA